MPARASNEFVQWINTLAAEDGDALFILIHQHIGREYHANLELRCL
jgi:hypothetical protein